MTAKVVNLRQHRKRKARDEREQQAAQNRVQFGRSKTERESEAAKRELDMRRLDAHRRSKSGEDE